jgi:capsular exopolysaccharide synthesis family protein
MNLTNRSSIPQSENTAPGFMEYIYLLWRWAWLIALVGVLAGGVAYLVAKNTTPVYQTTTRLLIINPPTQSSLDTTSLISGSTTTQTYSQMVKDTPVLEDVISDLQLTMTTRQLASQISVELVTGTQIITVNVEDTNPARAQKIAESLGVNFSAHILDMQTKRYSDSLIGLKAQRDDMETKMKFAQIELNSETEDSPLRKQKQDIYNQYSNLYINLDKNYQQTLLALQQTSTGVAVAEPPALPESPIRPKTFQNTLLTAILGLLFATGGVFAIDALDDTIKNPEEIRQKFGLTILGVIARHTSPAGLPITQDQPRSPVSESFRALRTNITYAAIDTPMRTIMITSATPQDGKTTVTSNLGVVFAQGGKKAVVIDGDMRRPQEDNRFGLENKSGLSELFVTSVDKMNGSAQKTGVEGLMVITSGKIPPNPAELMASKKMLQIIERLNTEYDLVLVDTPPVLSVTDAAALAPGVDGVILVAKPGVTKLSAFKQTLEQLQAVGARILGVVLNEVEPKSRKYGYYYHRYYNKYSYYYTPDGQKIKKEKK